MIRYIACCDCEAKAKAPPHPEDLLMGWKKRTILIAHSKVPADHHIEITTPSERIIEHVPKLRCDYCDKDIPDGDKVWAVTQWRSPEMEPGDWEEEFTAT